MSSQDISVLEKDAIVHPTDDGGGAGQLGLVKHTSRGTLPELKEVASHALSRVASRLTTRDIVDPGPPPDGGLQAWLQVAMAWIICFCTW